MSTNAIKVEAQLYLPGREFDEVTLLEVLGRLHDQLEAPLSLKMPKSAHFFKDTIEAWRDWRKSPKDRALWNEWSSDVDYLGTSQWSCTDVLLIFAESGDLRIGLELSRLDDGLVSKNEDLLQQAQRALEKMVSVAEAIPSKLLSKSTFILAVELNRQDDLARAWAERELQKFFEVSLIPAMQEVPGGGIKSFCQVVHSPERAQGLALDWSVVSKNDEVFVRAHGGAKQFVLQGKVVAKANFVFWARQGGAIGQVFSSGRPVLPSSRGVVFANANSTYRVSLQRSVIHKELRNSQIDLFKGKFHALEQMERDVKSVKEMAANVYRYTLNTTKAFLDLGVLTSATESNGLLDYLRETREQLLYESERFSPEAERAATELERTGGLLGWPGFILAGAALTLAAIDTWWGVMDAAANQDWKDQSKPIAFYSACIIALSILGSAVVFLGLAVREYQKRILKASRFGVNSSFLQNATSPSIVLLLACALALGAMAYLSVANAFRATQPSAVSNRNDDAPTNVEKNAGSTKTKD